MAQRSSFFDAIAGDRLYTAADWARAFASLWLRDGVVALFADDLAVAPTTPESMAVRVGLGRAWVQGYLFEVYSGPETLAIPASDATFPRIDRIVVRLDLSSGVRSVAVAVVQGTPAPTPAPPALTRNTTVWELSLAQVLVDAGALSIVAGKITDERSDESVCGYTAPTWLHAGLSALWAEPDQTKEFGKETLRWLKGWFKDLDLSGALTVGYTNPPANTRQVISTPDSGTWVGLLLRQGASATGDLLRVIDSAGVVKAVLGNDFRWRYRYSITETVVVAVYTPALGVSHNAGIHVRFPWPFVSNPVVTLNTAGLKTPAQGSMPIVQSVTTDGANFGFSTDGTQNRGFFGVLTYTATLA